MSLEYLDLLHRHQIVDDQTLASRKGRRDRALEIVDDAGRPATEAVGGHKGGERSRDEGRAEPAIEPCAASAHGPATGVAGARRPMSVARRCSSAASRRRCHLPYRVWWSFPNDDERPSRSTSPT